MIKRQFPLWLAALTTAVAPLHAGVEVVSRPDSSKANSNYVSNRAPLIPSAFIGLPVGSVEPGGWLREMLNRQRDGLTGHLGEISAWLQKEDSAWLSKDGKGKYGWEELPYWFKGYIELAYIYKDPKMLAEVHTWIEGVIASQRPDGDFGPDEHFEDGSRDYWANMIMLYCLQSYHEQSKDVRVLDLMTKYFKYQLTVPGGKMLTHYWQKMRGGDNIQAIHWLYNRTGDPKLLTLAETIHRCTADWTQMGTLPDWHNVNVAECFREPAQFYQQSHDEKDLQAAYHNHFEIRKRYGQVPGGMFGGDENCRPGYSDPRQAVETCGLVEQMLSDEMMMQITGDPFWGDHCEEVAFNSYPAAVMPDFRSLRYLTAPNMVVSDSRNHAPGIDNKGPFLMMNPFSSRCCQHNHSHGWPYFSKSLWMATPDNGVCAAMFSESKVQVKVAAGIPVAFSEETHYPFDDTIRFRFSSEKPVRFPFYLRIPAWCQNVKVAINGVQAAVDASSGKYVKIERGWKNGDTVALTLPMPVSVKRWERNHDSASVNYGPLTFSLKIGERYDRHDSTKTAIGDSNWQKGADLSKWPSFEIHPTTPWNYGLVLDPQDAAKSFTVKHGAWPADNFPFKFDSAPVTIEAKAKRIPEWQIDRYGLCAVLQASPVISEEPLETVTLIPMGAARLRISAFPVIGSGNRWVVPKAPIYQTSASHCFANDSVEAISDGLEPSSSSDGTQPRLTWWDHLGSREWAQLDLPEGTEVSGIGVYWFDDTGTGQCRIPKAWRLLYQSGGTWKPVTHAASDPPSKDQWNRMKFSPIKTSSLRLEVELKPDFSGGILEWSVK